MRVHDDFRDEPVLVWQFCDEPIVFDKPSWIAYSCECTTSFGRASGVASLAMNPSCLTNRDGMRIHASVRRHGDEPVFVWPVLQ